MDLGDSRAIICGDGTGITRKKINIFAFEFKCHIPGKKYKIDLVGNIQVLFSQVPFLKHLIPLLFQFKKTIIAYQKLVFQFHGTHNQNVLVVLEVSHKHSNYICLRETKQDILLDDKDSSITKQRTDIWLQLRK
jgi:hypothetical protein